MSDDKCFWDKKQAYFVRMRTKKDLSPQQRANLTLLETLLDQSFQAGYVEGTKRPALEKPLDNTRIVL